MSYLPSMLNREVPERSDQELWDYVGTDPTIQHLRAAENGVYLWPGEEDTELTSHFQDLVARYEQILYDKLSRHHPRPSEELATLSVR